MVTSHYLPRLRHILLPDNNNIMSPYPSVWFDALDTTGSYWIATCPLSICAIKPLWTAYSALKRLITIELLGF